MHGVGSWLVSKHLKGIVPRDMQTLGPALSDAELLKATDLF